MNRVSLIPCISVLVWGGCVTSSPRAPTSSEPPSIAATRASPEILKKRKLLKNALDRLPSIEEESFSDYQVRVRSALTQDAAAEVQALAKELWETQSEVSQASMHPMRPVLLANWAKSRFREKRKEFLSALIQHPTTFVAGQEIPGRNAAFDGFDEEIREQTQALGLSIDDLEKVAYEIMLSSSHHKARSEQVGVLVHADVVPADEPGWDTPPFAGIVGEDRIIGRGALDDKGPLVAALFALAALQDSHLPMRASPVLIIGTSEETHWHGIERLVAEKGLPKSVFVADGGFPAGIGEKGVTTVRVRTQAAPTSPTRAMDKNRLRLISFEGGQVSNQVPATARTHLQPLSLSSLPAWQAQLELLATQYPDVTLRVEPSTEGLWVHATGKAAHGASPSKGVNAVSHLARFLIERLQFADSPCAQLLWILDRQLGVGVDGTALGVGDTHADFSPATVNLGTFRQYDDGSCEAALNIRWPPPRTPEQIVNAVREAMMREADLLPGNGSLELEVQGGGLPPYLADRQSPLVKSLLSAYSHVTGEYAEPLTLSGTTYAKAVPGGGITFGPSMANQKSSRIHVPNEHLTFEEFDLLVEVYTLALANLCVE